MQGEQLYKVDDNGFPTEHVIVYFDEEGNLLTEVEDDIIKHIIPQGLIRPRWDGEKWVENMAQEDIAELYKLPIKDPTEIDMVKAQNKALSDRADFVEDIIAEMAMKVYV